MIMSDGVRRASALVTQAQSLIIRLRSQDESAATRMDIVDELDHLLDSLGHELVGLEELAS
jgi:hypothetical protein